MGCNIGYLTRPLSLRANTVGLEIQKLAIHMAKQYNKRIEFICCDICYLPLRESLIDLVVCGSVLEHVENLDQVLKEIRFTLKKCGKLVAGYPIETRLLESIIKSIWRSEAPVWSQKKIMNKKELLRDSNVYKQGYLEIRKSFEIHFSLLEKRKMPRNCIPDFFSIYECCVMRNKTAVS